MFAVCAESLPERDIAHALALAPLVPQRIARALPHRLAFPLTDRRHDVYGAVNKRFLSTGETGEFASENLGFGHNPGVELAPPRCLSSNRRERAVRKSVRNVVGPDEVDTECCRQQKSRLELGPKGTGSPENVVSNYLSALSDPIRV